MQASFPISLLVLTISVVAANSAAADTHSIVFHDLTESVFATVDGGPPIPAAIGEQTSVAFLGLPSVDPAQLARGAVFLLEPGSDLVSDEIEFNQYNDPSGQTSHIVITLVDEDVFNQPFHLPSGALRIEENGQFQDLTPFFIADPGFNVAILPGYRISIASHVSEVPLPAPAWLLGSAISGLAMTLRRRVLAPVQN